MPILFHIIKRFIRLDNSDRQELRRMRPQNKKASIPRQKDETHGQSDDVHV